MKLKALILALTLTVALPMLAQGPNGSKKYYQAADGKSGAELKTALFGIIKEPRVVSYSALIDAYKKTDTRPDGYLRDWYSNVTTFTPGSSCGSYKKEGDAYNREHSMPQSWYNKSGSMRSDIVQVIPTDGYVNNRRSDHPFGEVSKPTWSSANGYSKVGPSKTPGYTGTVFEPNDEVKGDIARIYFYMMTCYESSILTWNNGTADDVIDFQNGTKLQPLKQWVFDMMLRWAQSDPIDSIERARNNAVYAVQKNRNPFVDYPGLELYIWGAKQDVAFSYDKYEGVQQDEYPEPDDPNPDDPNPDDPNPDDPQPGDDPLPTSGSILLSNEFFGIPWSTSRPANSDKSYTGTANGISVTYDMGNGSNMYANDQQIRLYPGNTLTFASNGRAMTDIAFTVVLNKENKQIEASTGTVSGYRWTGHATEVVFTVNSGSGHIQLSAATVAVEKRRGDVDANGIVNVSDVTALISHILQRTPENFDADTADLNGDGLVNVTDVSLLIDIILGKESQLPQ